MVAFVFGFSLLNSLRIMNTQKQNISWLSPALADRWGWGQGASKSSAEMYF